MASLAHCFIYAMRGLDSGLVKIGRSWNPRARLRSYTDALGEGDVARLYAEGGKCTWDSRDGAMKSKGERKAA